MRKITTLLLICLCAAGPVFSQQTVDLEGLKKGVNDFSKRMAYSLPFNSSIGLNWSDAYIGQVLDAPPHFGVGFTAGFTSINSSTAEKMLKQFDLDMPIDWDSFPLVGYTLEGRVGGFFLPFDIGIKVGYLDAKLDSFETNYLLLGGDFRYAILKGDVLPLKLSVGVGYNYMQGGVAMTQTGDMLLSYGGYTIGMPNPKVGLVWETSSVDVKAQASFSLAILTPYLGVGASYAWSKAGIKVDGKLKGSNSYLDTEAKKAIKGLGFDVTNEGISSIVDVENLSTRVFGGFSVNLVAFRIDFTGLYNILDANYGATVGARFQL